MYTPPLNPSLVVRVTQVLKNLQYLGNKTPPPTSVSKTLAPGMSPRLLSHVILLNLVSLNTNTLFYTFMHGLNPFPSMSSLKTFDTFSDFPSQKLMTPPWLV